MKGGNTFDRIRVPVEPWGRSLTQEVEGLSLDENVAMSVGESLRMQGRTETSGMDMLPLQRMSSESKVNETGQEKEKNIFLAKPSAESVTQKEVLVPATNSGYTVFGVWGVGSIEGKKVWRCFICQVSATSEADLKQYFTGSKHRSKRAVLKAEKSAAVTVEAVQTSQIEPTPPPIPTAKPLDGHGNSASILPGNKNTEKGWCEMGTGGASNKYVMKTKIEPLMPTPRPTATPKPLDGHVNLTEEEEERKGQGKFCILVRNVQCRSQQ